MSDLLKLADVQQTVNMDFERQRHLANWLIKSRPHMATLQHENNSSTIDTGSTIKAHITGPNIPNVPPTHDNNQKGVCISNSNLNCTSHISYLQHVSAGSKYIYLTKLNNNMGAVIASTKSTSNVTSATTHTGAHLSGHLHSQLRHPHHRNHHGLSHLADSQRAKLRRFNSHGTNSNMFSAADFENARLARRNKIELRQHLQKHLRNGFVGGSNRGLLRNTNCGLVNNTCNINTGYETAGDNNSKTEPLPVEEFLERYSLPRVAKIFYKSKCSHVTLQSSSSSSTITSTSSACASGGLTVPSSIITNIIGSHVLSLNSSSNTGTSSSTSSASATANVNVQLESGISNGCKSNNQIANNNNEKQGKLFLLYRLVRQRHVYHGQCAKSTANSKKGVLIPQEFPGYFSLLNDKGFPTATQYTSLIQLVREGVFKFVSVDNMTAFIESDANNSQETSSTEGCLNIYSYKSNTASNNRSQYVKITAYGGQVYKLLDVLNYGKQHRGVLGITTCSGSLSTSKTTNAYGREKEKGYYAILLNEQKQVVYVSMSTKGKFYEIERGVPQVLEKYLNQRTPKDINPDCVHRIASLINPHKELPITLKYVSGPNDCAQIIPENLCVTRITTENIIIACPIEDIEIHNSLHLRKLHLSQEMTLLHSTLDFETDQRMISNANIQHILKFCQFNFDQFLKMVEPKICKTADKSSSKNRRDGLKIFKPLHLPFTFLRREKTSISAHEKEDSIIFLSKVDLANMENKDHNYCDVTNRITDKINVFQSSKKKWFLKQHKRFSNSELNMDEQSKRMSMERYTDTSKLLQKRFADRSNIPVQPEHESVPGNRISLSRASKANALQKSRSLQDIELCTVRYRKSNILNELCNVTDTISECGIDIEDIENHEPMQQSFITEKLYNEFHVKTKQYSRSSSNLYQLKNFSFSQKLQIGNKKRSLVAKKHLNNSNVLENPLDFNIVERVSGRRVAGGLNLITFNQSACLSSTLTPTSLMLVEDDLPYANVRDSLIFPSDKASLPDGPSTKTCHAFLYSTEDIYAEICPQIHDNISAITHSTKISDNYGDYAFLASASSASIKQMSNKPATIGLGNAVSCVEIVNSDNSVRYYTPYFKKEPEAEQHLKNGRNGSQKAAKRITDRSHITKVDVVSYELDNIDGKDDQTEDSNESGDLYNIYNTLK